MEPVREVEGERDDDEHHEAQGEHGDSISGGAGPPQARCVWQAGAMPADMAALCDDLAAEHADLDAIVAVLDDGGWARPTPAEGWAVRDQIFHLAYFDDAATRAAIDPEGFAADASALAADVGAAERKMVEEARALAPRALLARWRGARARLLETFRELDPSTRLPWYGPPMSAASSATARMMETWAHGQDVADAVGVVRRPTPRLRHIAHLGVRTRHFSYAVRGLPAPEGEVRVELRGPDGDVWTWGAEDAADRVVGPALDFCLVVTQRRNVKDTALVASGPLAEEWLQVAQAFAGPPGPGRPPS
jgi:uncharacterized protein (TIGR03084 family)